MAGTVDVHGRPVGVQMVAEIPIHGRQIKSSAVDCAAVRVRRGVAVTAGTRQGYGREGMRSPERRRRRQIDTVDFACIVALGVEIAVHVEEHGSPLARACRRRDDIRIQMLLSRLRVGHEQMPGPGLDRVDEEVARVHIKVRGIGPDAHGRAGGNGLFRDRVDPIHVGQAVGVHVQPADRSRVVRCGRTRRAPLEEVAVVMHGRCIGVGVVHRSHAVAVPISVR